MDNYTVTIGNEERIYQSGTTFLEIAKDFQKEFRHDIVLVYAGGKLQELYKKLDGDCDLRFITTETTIGHNTYLRSMCMLYVKAVYDVIGHDKVNKVRMLFAVGSGYYSVIDGDTKVDEAFVSQVKSRMHELIAQDMPITKRSIHTDDAIRLFADLGMKDKQKLFKYRRVSKVNVYRMEDYEDYYYGYMVPSAGYLSYFDLKLFENGIVLQMPIKANPDVVPAFAYRPKLFQVQLESTQWGDIQDIETVGDLNECITKGDPRELILVHEALQEKKIAEIASEIARQGNKKFVLIAGPSSSGKTTFSHRLSIQLKVNGLKPHPIAVDNYFVNRDKTPLDEDGKYNYECLEAIDVEQLNQDLTRLLAGEKVEIPSFNFKKGVREYHGDFLELGENDVLVIEGIHGLNDKMTYQLPQENKFKIYISALTQLNIDEHNRIPTTDGRLLRRMVRDARTRGTSAKATIGMWQSVRRGEEENIFTYQEEADVMFNSALIYEFAALKQFAEPILFGIEKDCPEYVEAKRLLKFLDYFVGIPTDYIPMNSLIKEFIGKGCFDI